MTLLTDTARRMAATLPSYYEGEPLLDRMLQARANEIDRLDAIVDQLAAEVIPGQATDAFGLLGLWEAHLDLPVRPADATEGQRRAKVNAALRALDSASSADALDAIMAAMGGTGTFELHRDTPSALTDTLTLSVTSTSYNAIVIKRIALRLYPAHRNLLFSFADGFVLDLSLLDQDAL